MICEITARLWRRMVCRKIWRLRARVSRWLRTWSYGWLTRRLAWHSWGWLPRWLSCREYHPRGHKVKQLVGNQYTRIFNALPIGCKDGMSDGWHDGRVLGWHEGRVLGWSVGIVLGSMEGCPEGWSEGCIDGCIDGRPNHHKIECNIDVNIFMKTIKKQNEIKWNKKQIHL